MTSATCAMPDALRKFFERSNIPLALSFTEGDAPLAAVNPGFCALTGYSEEESLGRNCRFLQGPGTTGDSRAQLHAFVHDGNVNAGRFPVLNYRKSGEAFHNFVFMTRIRDRAGVTRFILASQFDVTDTMRRAQAAEHDRELRRNLTEVETIAKEFGLAMMGSAQILADSAATIARLALDDRR